MSERPDRWIARYSRAVSVGYVLHELVRAQLSRTRMRILFSDVPEVAPQFEKWFAYTDHVIAFGEFREEVLGNYDLIVPLHLNDVLRLGTMRQHLAHNPIPLPSDRAIEITSDKLLFHRAMEQNGFANLVPRAGDDVGFPYLLKRRLDEAGRNSVMVMDEAQNRSLMEGVDSRDYLRQEYIEGRIEYTTHALLIGGRIVRSLTIRHDMGRVGIVKGPVQPILRTLVRSAHLKTFSRILRSLDYEGLCNIDFKLRDERPVVMEINPRIGGSLVPYFFSFVRSLTVPTGAHRGGAS